jgi:hypothetical protein
MALYHRETGFPGHFQAPDGKFTLAYREHARRAAAGDEFGDLTPHLPATLDTAKARLVEVETTGRKLTKLLYRLPLDPRHDLVLAVNPDWSVRTVWSNARCVRHHSLRSRRYARAA